MTETLSIFRNLLQYSQRALLEDYHISISLNTRDSKFKSYQAKLKCSLHFKILELNLLYSSLLRDSQLLCKIQAIAL